MRIFTLLLVLIGFINCSAQAPAKAVAKHTSQSGSNKQVAPTAPREAYSKDELLISAQTLPRNYKGNDPATLLEAISASPALKARSEFETSDQYEARKASFLTGPLTGTLGVSSTFAFVVNDDGYRAPTFAFDADTSIMEVSVGGISREFILDKDQARLDTLTLTSHLVSHDSYIGSNAYGAEVKVSSMFIRQFGLTFPTNRWPFQDGDRFDRKWVYLIPMSADKARAFKPNAAILLIAKLVSPWTRHYASGHKATIDNPTEATIDEQYLQIQPLQIWIFDRSTGEILAKADSTLNPEQAQLKIKKTPLTLVLDTSSVVTFEVSRDGGKSESKVASMDKTTLTANRSMTLVFHYPSSLDSIKFSLNGQPFFPSWEKDSQRIGQREFINKASFTIAAP
jgi:hypothetical protein